MRTSLIGDDPSRPEVALRLVRVALGIPLRELEERIGCGKLVLNAVESGRNGFASGSIRHPDLESAGVRAARELLAEASLCDLEGRIRVALRSLGEIVGRFGSQGEKEW